MTPDIDIETLRVLVAVDEHRSVTAAAAALGLSQPAASARIREFEARWRVAVLSRGPRGSAPTDDGRAVLAWARTTLASVDVMRRGLTELMTARTTALTVAASLTVAEFVLPPWLAELHLAQPDIRPRLAVVNSDAVADLVRHGEADLGFIETAVLPTDLAHRRVGVDRLAVVVSPRHPWSGGTPTTEQLCSADWVLREPGSGTRATFERALGAVPTVALEAASTTSLVAAAAAGVGPAVVSRRAVAVELDRQLLVEVETGLELVRPLNALWRRGVRLSSPGESLLAVAVGSH